jgi:hypothetical protein
VKYDRSQILISRKAILSHRGVTGMLEVDQVVGVVSLVDVGQTNWARLKP